MSERVVVSMLGAGFAGALMQPRHAPDGACSSSGQESSTGPQQHDAMVPVSVDWAQRSSVQQQNGMSIAITIATNRFEIDAENGIICADLSSNTIIQTIRPHKWFCRILIQNGLRFTYNQYGTSLVRFALESLLAPMNGIA